MEGKIRGDARQEGFQASSRGGDRCRNFHGANLGKDIQYFSLKLRPSSLPMAGNDKIRQFETLFHRFQPQLVKFAVTLLRDIEVAREAVQDVFVNIWQKRETLEYNEDLKAYLYRAVRNHCLNLIKKKRLDVVPLDERLVGLPDAPGDEGDEKQQMIRRVYGEIAKLPPKAQEIFMLSRLEGL
ncbi:MAG: sigma-70 family RNA polymerase sigma factor, partial [Bacteroidota bacterium]